MRARLVLAAVVVFYAFQATGQSLTLSDLSIQPQNVAAPGLAQPLAMRFLGDAASDFFVIEKATGQVKRFTNGVANAPLAGGVVLDLPVNSASERGLLGITLQPNFDPTGASANNKVYLYYSRAATDNGTWIDNRVERFSWDGSVLTTDNLFFTVNSFDATQSNGPNHDGGPILFGPDGMLYGITGELNRGRSEANQGTQASLSSSQAGGIYRLTPDLTVPSDNPFVSTQANTAFHRWYAYGIRNSFGLTIDPANGNLWETENGPTQYDEINLVAPGFNSGWSDIMGPDSRDPQGLSDLIDLGSGSTYSDPEFSWLSPIAVTQLHFLQGSKLGSAFDNKVLVADSNNGQLYLFTLNAGRTGFDFTGLSGLETDLVADSVAERNLLRVGTGFGDGAGGATDIVRGPDGFVYVVALGDNAIYRLAPGDLDDDRDVDASDIDRLWLRIRTGADDPGANDSEDLNADGFVNEDDVDYLLANLINPGHVISGVQYGDADLDGGVGGLDYTAWRLRAGTGWANGDFDGDGGVGGLDYTLWRTRPTQYPGTVGPHPGTVAAVPEPSAALLAVLGCTAIVAGWRARARR